MRASLIVCSLAMRAFSTSSRAAISASSTVRVRSISRWRTSRSEAMRASLIACSFEMRDFSISSREVSCACSASVSRTRPLAREFGALDGAAHFHVALLVQPRGLAFALDIERLPLGFEVAGADQDHRFLLDVVAQLAPRLDFLDQLGQAFGVEAVRRVEVFEVGLVEVGNGDGLQLQAVLREAFGGGFLHALDIIAALLVHFLHGHFGRDRAQRRDELAGEQRMQPLRLHGAAAEASRQRPTPLP